MPTDDSFWFDDDERIAPTAPDLREPDPEEAIRGAESRRRMKLVVNYELLPQSKILERQLARIFECQEEGVKECKEGLDHTGKCDVGDARSQLPARICSFGEGQRRIHRPKDETGG